MINYVLQVMLQATLKLFYLSLSSDWINVFVFFFFFGKIVNLIDLFHQKSKKNQKIFNERNKYFYIRTFRLIWIDVT